LYIQENKNNAYLFDAPQSFNSFSACSREDLKEAFPCHTDRKLNMATPHITGIAKKRLFHYTPRRRLSGEEV
jgi:hypothetical protein